jgi:hypothetical protein
MRVVTYTLASLVFAASFGCARIQPETNGQQNAQAAANQQRQQQQAQQRRQDGKTGTDPRARGQGSQSSSANDVIYSEANSPLEITGSRNQTIATVTLRGEDAEMLDSLMNRESHMVRGERGEDFEYRASENLYCIEGSAGGADQDLRCITAINARNGAPLTIQHEMLRPTRPDREAGAELEDDYRGENLQIMNTDLNVADIILQGEDALALFTALQIEESDGENDSQRIKRNQNITCETDGSQHMCFFNVDYRTGGLVRTPPQSQSDEE